jgi:hypothetical protein
MIIIIIIILLLLFPSVPDTQSGYTKGPRSSVLRHAAPRIVARFSSSFLLLHRPRGNGGQAASIASSVCVNFTKQRKTADSSQFFGNPRLPLCCFLVACRAVAPTLLTVLHRLPELTIAHLTAIGPRWLLLFTSFFF